MPRVSIPGWREISGRRALTFISGPCVIESEAMCLEIAQVLKRACRATGARYVFKASDDKANRTSSKSFR